MKERNKKKLFDIKCQLIILCLAPTLAISALMSNPVCVLSIDSNTLKITKIEKILFFKTYDSESIEKRLDRLEKRYFGETRSGKISNRVEKIYQLAKPQIEAKNKESTTEVDENSNSLGETSQYPKMKTTFEDPDKEKELDKKKLQVMQARDEEIRVLLKEGISFWKKRDAVKAESKFLQVVRLDPRNEAAFFSLGVLYEAKGKLNKALQNYNKAHNINPNRMDYKDAIVVVKTALEKKNKKSQLAIEAASAFKRKEYISALALYKRLEKQSPKKALYKYNIGTIYLLMKSPEQALEYYGKARKLTPEEPRYIRAYEKLDKVIKDNEAARIAREKEWDKFEQAKRINEQRNFSKRRPAANPTRPNMTQGQPNNPGFNQSRPGPQQNPNNRQPTVMPPQLAHNYFRSIGVSVAPSPSGIKINTVEIGSRAAVSGIKPGDVIISVDGQSVNNISHMATMMARKVNGQKSQLLVKRQGQVGQILF